MKELFQRYGTYLLVGKVVLLYILLISANVSKSHLRKDKKRLEGQIEEKSKEIQELKTLKRDYEEIIENISVDDYSSAEQDSLISEFIRQHGL